MRKEAVDCIECGTEYCPCKLAESGECLICSQCQGKCFCDCLNWKGVCVYQELDNNDYKAKDGRKTYDCLIKDIVKFSDKLIMIKFKAPHKLVLDLVKPGSYIFIRTDQNNYFDIPISIMDSNLENDIITIVVEIKGIKTDKLLNAKISENIIIRGPYWNGVFGLKNIYSQTSGKALILSRGIGMAPMMPVIRKLLSQNNELKIIVDETPFDNSISHDLLADFHIDFNKSILLEKGTLSDHGKVIIKDSLLEGTNYIHIAGADILTYEVIKYLDALDRKDVKLSCCNNFKMCCGEGICGACTVRFAGHKIRRFCKEQTDPRNIFEGRRFI